MRHRLVVPREEERRRVLLTRAEAHEARGFARAVELSSHEGRWWIEEEPLFSPWIDVTIVNARRERCDET